MRLFFINLFLLNALIGFCQVDLFFPLNNEFDWARIEKQNRGIKEKLLKNLPAEFELNRYDYDETDLHVIDFNGDGLDDVVFNGHLAGSELLYIVIFINRGESFEKIFTEHQEFHKIVFDNGKATQLYIHNGGCCCDYVLINKIYTIEYTFNQPQIKLISQMRYPNIGIEEYPDCYFERPVKFEVLNDRYNIRLSPVIDDVTESSYCGEIRAGNSLGKIKSGSIGYALAEKSDSTGRVWWFVALCSDSEIYESIYYDCDNTQNDYKLGWISSKYAKRVDE